MNTKNTDIPSLPTNKTQKRLYAASLDSTYEHENMDAMIEYLKTPISYHGQILYCRAEDNLYKISNTYGEKTLDVIGVTDMERIPYENENYPELTNLKLAIDFILNDMNNQDGTVYYGISTLDGINDEITKEYIINNFEMKSISKPDPASSNSIEKLHEHVCLDFGVNEEPHYFYAAFPIKRRNVKARDLSSSFGDGWFNWNEDAESDFLKIITLPDKNGILREYMLLRSDNMLLDGSNWIFYFAD